MLEEIYKQTKPKLDAVHIKAGIIRINLKHTAYICCLVYLRLFANSMQYTNNYWHYEMLLSGLQNSYWIN